MLAEVARVLVPGGRFLFYGVHPCFNGPHVEVCPDGSRLVHTSNREARRHLSAPWWGADGIRTKSGGMRHVPHRVVGTAARVGGHPPQWIKQVWHCVARFERTSSQ